MVVYLVWCCANNKFYIGSTTNFERRKKAYLGSHGTSNKIIRNCKKKYPGSIKVKVLKQFSDEQEMINYEYELIEHFYDDKDCCNIKRYKIPNTYKYPIVADYFNNGTKDLRILKYMALKSNEYKVNHREEFLTKQANGRFKNRKSFSVTEPDGTVRIVSGMNNLQFLYPELKSLGNISSCCSGKLKHYKRYRVRKYF
jgi:predicted GIY-YIG superfamily endonuclease